MNERIREHWSECVKRHTKIPMNWQNVADEFAKIIRTEAIEEAAIVCDSYNTWQTAEMISASIRKLK